MCSVPVRILIIAACCAILWFGINGLVSGEDSPFNCWLSVGTYLIAGIGGILFALFSLKAAS